MGPAALVAEAGDAFGRSAAALAAPGERLAGPADAAAVPIQMASPAGFTAEAGSTHILTASVVESLIYTCKSFLQIEIGVCTLLHGV